VTRLASGARGHRDGANGHAPTRAASAIVAAMRSTTLVVLLAACGAGAESAGPPCEGTPVAGEAPELAEVRGSVLVYDGQSLVDADGGGFAHRANASADAFFVDRDIPGFSVPFGVFVGLQRETAREGACRLLESVPTSCDPACGPAEICVEPGECLPYLVDASAGAIAIDAGEALSLAHDGFSGYQSDHRPVAGGFVAECDAITATAAGDAVPAFSLAAPGVAPMPADVLPTVVDLDDGSDLRVSWSPALAHGRVRLRLLSPNRGHGTPVVAILECDAPDSAGELTVPRALIERMPPSHADYCAGFDCPESSLVRYARTTTEAGGGVIELIVASGTEFRTRHNPDQVPE
jgi:hypothetical protein